jgi:hypothetical protein
MRRGSRHFASRGSGNGPMNSSPAINSLVAPGLVHTTRHRSGRLVRKTSTIWPGTIWPRNRSRTPESDILIVDESSMRPPPPEPVANGACNVNVTRLPRRNASSLGDMESEGETILSVAPCQVPRAHIEQSPTYPSATIRKRSNRMDSADANHDNRSRIS